MSDNNLPEPKKKRGGRPFGSSAISNPAIKAIRAQAILEARMQGVPVATLAAQYRVSDKSIYRIIKWAETEGLLQELQLQLLTKLGQKTINAYEAALDMDVKTATQGEVEATKVKLVAAKDIGFGAGLLSKKSEQTVVKEEYSMSAYIERKYGSGEQTANEEGDLGSPAIHDGSIIDAESITEEVVSRSSEAAIPSWRDPILADVRDAEFDESGDEE